MKSRLHLVLSLVLLGASSSLAHAKVGSPFRPVVVVKEEQALHLTLVGTTPIIQYDNDGFALATLGPGRIVRDERWMVGIAHCGDVSTTSFTGRFPGAAWLVKDLHAWSACPDDDAHILRWTGAAWRMIETVDAHNVLVAPWQRGSALVVEVPRRPGPPWGYELRLVQAAAGLEPPRPTPARRQPDNPSNCYTELEGPISLTTGADGSALVVGTTRCMNDDREPDGRPVAEYFAPGARQGRVLVAPITLGTEAAVAFVRTPRGFWVGGLSKRGRSALARFDGVAWTVTAGPPGQLLSISVDDASAMWALTQSDDAKVVWQKRGSGKWLRVPLPEGASPIESLVVRPGGDAWLVAGRALYSTLPVHEVLSWRPHACDEAEMERVQREETAVHAVQPRDGQSRGNCCGELPLGPAF